jgi:hypothetical protein
MQLRQDLVRASLEKFANGVVEQAKANIARENKNVTGNLANSLQYYIEVNPNSIALQWKMDELAPYWKFQELWCQGQDVIQQSPQQSLPIRYREKRYAWWFDSCYQPMGAYPQIPIPKP